MIERISRSWNRTLLLMPALLASLAFGAMSCGDAADANEVEGVRGAVHGVGPWTIVPNGIFNATPAIARHSGGRMTAFGLGTDSHIYVTRQDNNEVWSAGWTEVPGGAFSTQPAAAAIHLSIGPLVQRFAIVAKGFDNQYYITIRDQFGGGTVQDWAALPIGTFISAPAVTHIPPSSPIAPANTLIVAGLGFDNRIYVAKNTLSGGVYNHNSWITMGAVGDQTFVSAPTVSPPCDFTYPRPGMFVAAMTSSNTYRYSRWTGASFTPWTDVYNGIFNSGPALATGCGSPDADVAIYGRGLDNRIYYSTQLTGNGSTFKVIGAETFSGEPTATGFRDNSNTHSLMVAEMNDSGFMFTSKAFAH